MAETKTSNRHIHLSSEEALKLKECADKCGLTQSQYIRTLINGYIPKEKPEPEFYELMRSFYELLNSLEDKGLDEQLNEDIRIFLFEIEKKVLRPEKRTENIRG